MHEQFKAYVESERLIGPGARVLAAISGGADSVALADLLHRAGHAFELAHCNFKLRGSESDGDEAFVRQLGEDYGVEVHVKAFRTREHAASKGISIQMAARELRYGWFEQLRHERGADCIALAHHADDNIETVINNIIRGTGIRGLSGMAARQGIHIRPLLFANRASIMEYINKRGLSYREDASNADVKYARNRIRHHILPEMEKINPAFRPVMAQNIRNWATYRAFFEKSAEAFRQKHVAEHKEGLTELPTRELLNTDNQVFVYDLLASYGFNASQTEEIGDAAKGQSGKVFYSASYMAVIDRGKMLITENKEANRAVYTINVHDNQINEPIRLKIRTYESLRMSRISKSANEANLDQGKLAFPLKLRTWQKGDRFRPLGMKGTKKLSDFFTDQKMSRIEKEETWLLCSGDDIVWVLGHRIDERYKVDEKTKKVWNARIVSN